MERPSSGSKLGTGKPPKTPPIEEDVGEDSEENKLVTIGVCALEKKVTTTDPSSDLEAWATAL